VEPAPVLFTAKRHSFPPIEISKIAGEPQKGKTVKSIANQEVLPVNSSATQASCPEKSKAKLLLVFFIALSPYVCELLTVA
jgi:hypothetical protein